MGPVKVAFLVNDLGLSGGIGVVVQHARQLHDRHGCDVALVLVRRQEDPHWEHEALTGLRVIGMDEARADRFDVVLSTWWETAFSLFEVPAGRYASFVQSLEDRFYQPHELERFVAALVLDLPVAFVTEAHWIADTLRDLRPGATVELVRNGIDKDVFAPVDAPEEHDGPLRVLVEGYADTWFKGVNSAIAAVRLMEEPVTLTVVAPSRAGLDATGADRVIGPIPMREMAREYAAHDVVLKLSQVEGMYGPPLEGFHRGATCVTTEVTGHEEYIRHGENALVCDWDDLRGTARQLDLLARDRALLARLRAAALDTARAWPDWTVCGDEMFAALSRIVASPPPDADAAAGRMLADLRGAMEGVRLQLAERDELRWKLARYERLKDAPGIRQARRVHGSRGGQAVLKALHPATRRVKRKLLGP